jgi:hypothetical protein
MSAWEIGQRRFVEKDQSATRASALQFMEADLAAKIEDTVNEAVAMRTPVEASDRARTKSIRTNRADEKQSNREAEAFRLGDRTQSQPKEANVIPLRPESDYSEPDITEILGSLDDDKP